jgi:hypothetical protein
MSSDMRSILCAIALTFTTIAGSQTLKSASASQQSFAGQWWAKANVEERSGFLNGAADCLTWTAQRTGFNATPEQLMDKITEFYKLHPESFDQSVIDVWQGISDQPKPRQAAGDHGERWSNPHWYLNGDWWSQVSELSLVSEHPSPRFNGKTFEVRYFLPSKN